MRQKLLIALLLILLTAVVTFVIQNTAEVQVQFLWLTVAMPRAALVITLLSVGFAGGLIFSMLRRASD